MTEKRKEKKAALLYHQEGRPGKIEVNATKPCDTSRDLSLAYSPGVAYPCLEIAKNPDDVYKYTAKGNLVAVVSNGSAVLGLGNIGALAGKPVMEGKGVLFKKFADVDVFDIEVDEATVEGMVKVVKSLEPTFGGINLEDIKAPECFEIERQLVELMDIPVFHDDQHGTAIISSAAFINALEITKRKASKTKVVFSGAGAASIACARLFLYLGVKPENLYMTDSKGVIWKGRPDGMNQYKEEFANDTKHRTLEDVMKGADAFIGCSAKGVLTKEMVKTMAKKPIIFAMANPDPEILPEEVAEVRNDAIMATGRSDYPNQVNNVLGFPFIFRGALDVRARKINEEMKVAAVYALAKLAKEEVPENVKAAYGGEHFSFGPNYLIPKPFDTRALTHVAPAVAKAAMDSGVARIELKDIADYARYLEQRLGHGAEFIKSLRDRLDKRKKKKVVFAEGRNTRILQAVSILIEENRIEPILVGDPQDIHERMDELGLSHLKDIQIIHPKKSDHFEQFAEKYYDLRKRKGVNYNRSFELMARANYFSAMYIREGFADAMITGATLSYPECIKPIIHAIGTKNKIKAIGIIILVFKHKILFLADCTAQIKPSSEDLSQIALTAAEFFEYMIRRKPKVAFLSYSNFGSNTHPDVLKVSKAVELTKARNPDLQCDGEMQADVAVNTNIQEKLFDFNSLQGAADVLVFPDLSSANISYKLLTQLAEVTPIGPILVPLNKAANIVQRTSTVTEIVNMSTMTAAISQTVESTRNNKK